MDEVRIDGAVLLFCLAVSLATGFLAGTIPARRAARIDPNEALKRGTATSVRGDLRNLLVTAEIGLAFTLVSGAGLLAKSFLRLTAVNGGFDPHHVLTLNLSLTGSRYGTPAAARDYYRQVLEKVRAIPGILGAGLISNVPLSHTEPGWFRVEGRPVLKEAEAPSADVFWASPDYFRVLAIPLKRGRFYLGDATGPPEALVSESFARMQFPAANAIGRRIQLDPEQDGPTWYTIVGIVADVRNEGLDRPPDQAIYLPQTEAPFHYVRLATRTAAEPGCFERAVRAAIREVDTAQAIFHVQPMDDYVASSLADRTFTLSLIGLFGTVALLLAAAGIYGVISYNVGLRTREIGIRTALGAERLDIVRMILLDVVRLLAWGLGVGLLMALALTRFLSHMLFQVRPGDIKTSAGVGLALASLALSAARLPALRAAQVDPTLALRSE